jgi:Ca2+-binding RTX toxin-like protein
MLKNLFPTPNCNIPYLHKKGQSDSCHNASSTSEKIYNTSEIFDTMNFVIIIAGISVIFLGVFVFSMGNAQAQTQSELQVNQGQSERGKVFKEPQDISPPANISQPAETKNFSNPISKAKNNFSSKFGTSFDDSVAGIDKNLPASTSGDLNSIKCQTNPENNRVPCYGTDNSDDIIGTDTDDFIYGLKGDDTISGLGSLGGPAGYNYIDGGDGSDSLSGGVNHDIISGGNSKDNIYGKQDDDLLSGGEGDDHIDGGTGNDRLWGGTGGDTMKGGDGDDKIYHNTSQGSIFFDYSSPDGSKDSIDCGDGQDEVWLNQESDGDEAINCEKVHTSHPDLRSDVGNMSVMQPEASK